MVRESLSIAAGFVSASIVDSRLVRAVRRRYYTIKLNLLQREIEDTADDIAGLRVEATQLRALADRAVLGLAQPETPAAELYFQAHNRLLDAEALIDFYRQLKDERNRLRALLRALA